MVIKKTPITEISIGVIKTNKFVKLKLYMEMAHKYF